MPLDSSIPLQVKAPQFDSPFESQAKALQLKDMIGRSQLADMQLGQQKSAVERQTRLRDLYSGMSADMKEGDRIAALRNAGYQDEAEKWEGAALKRDESRSKTEAEKFKLMKDQNDYVNGALSSLLADQQLTHDKVIAQVSGLVQRGFISPEQGAQTVRELPGDIGALRSKLLTAAMQSAEAGKRLDLMLPKFEKTDTGGAVQMGTVNQLTGQFTPGQAVKKTQTPDSVASVAATMRGQNMADARSSEANDAQKQAARVQVMDTPDGVMLIDKGTGLARPAARMDGKPIAGKEKALTEAQAKASSFLGQMKAAEETLGQISPNQVNLLEQANVAAAGSPVNILASAKGQQTRQAQEQWAEAFLRYKTGAAATEGEVVRNVRTFFPQMGDSQAVIDQKARMREQAVADIAVSAGPGGKQIEVVPSIKERSAAKPAPKPGAMVDGYVYMGGDPASKSSWRKQ